MNTPIDSLAIDPIGSDRKELAGIPSSVLFLTARQRDTIGDLCVAILKDSTFAGLPYAVRVYRVGRVEDLDTWMIQFTAALCATEEEARAVWGHTRAVLTGVLRMRRR